MKILIPSRSRARNLVTPYEIPKKHRHMVRVYVAQEQYDEYVRHNPNLDIRTCSDMNDLLGQKLYLMAKDTTDDEHVMMCDDDFRWFTRIEEDAPQLRKLEEDEFQDMFAEVMCQFTNPNIYGVGISMRQGNNRLEPEGGTNTRLNGCVTYNRELFLSCEHDRVNPMNDFDVNLQLLRRGYDNHLVSQYCYNQVGGTNAPGGSSDYRTQETQSAAAERLAELHPGFVRTRLKVNKSGPENLRERKEVTVYWKKARASACS